MRSHDTVAKPPVTTMAVQHVDRVTTRLELTATTVTAGANVHGTLVVDNSTGAPLKGTTCGDPFFIRLATPRFTPTVVAADCAEDFTIPTGLSRYPITGSTSYAACTHAGADATLDVPKCAAGGKTPKLPAGTYTAELGGATSMVSTPTPVTVTIR